MGIELSLEKAGQFFGVDPRTVRNWIRAGCPANKGKNDRWSLNSAAVSEWLRSRERENALGEVTSIDENEARRRKLAAEASLAEHELAMKQGSAVAVAQFEEKMAAMIGNARLKILTMGTKLAPLLLNCCSESEAKEIIDTGVRETLLELSAEGGGDVSDNGEGFGGPAGSGYQGRGALVSAARSDHQRVGRRAKKAEPRVKR